MRHLNGVYTQAVNRKYKTEGSLFRGRFKSILIEKESYLEELVRYIHRNPYRAKLEKEIGRHKWTSHFAYMHKQKRPWWLKTEDLLLQFSDYEKDALYQLDSFVKKEVPKDLYTILRRTKWPAILGNEAFKARIREKLHGRRIEKREVPQYKETMANLSANEIITKLEEKTGKKGIFTQKKSRRYASKRKAAAYICRQHLYIPCRDICSALGGISYAALSKQFHSAREEIKNKQGCYQDFKAMVDMLKLKVKT